MPTNTQRTYVKCELRKTNYDYVYLWIEDQLSVLFSRVPKEICKIHIIVFSKKEKCFIYITNPHFHMVQIIIFFSSELYIILIVLRDEIVTL